MWSQMLDPGVTGLVLSLTQIATVTFSQPTISCIEIINEFPMFQMCLYQSHLGSYDS